MKKALATSLALALALPAAGGVTLRSKCDNSQSVLCDGLGAIYEMEEDNDSSRKDSFGFADLYEPNGVNVARATGKLGSWAASFDGSTSYLHSGLAGEGVGMLGNSYWTVALWVYADTIGTNGQMQYLVAETSANRKGTDIFFYNNAGVFKAYARVHGAVTEVKTEVLTAAAVSTAAWHLIVVTFRPETFSNSGELTLQIDNGTRVTASVTEPILTGQATLIGRALQTSPGYFDGRIDQLVFSGIAWTTTDAGLFYNSGSGRVYPFDTN